MQLSDPSLWSEIERLTKNLAWEKYFPKAELGDLVQDVYARILDPEYKNKAIPNGVIHYGYVRQCISSVIADHKWEYLKRNDYLKAKAARTSKKQPQTSLSSEEPLSDSYVVDNHYSGDSVSPDVLQGEMDSLRSEQSPFNEYYYEQMLTGLNERCCDMEQGLRKDVFRHCLSGMTDGGASQGKDIAAKLGRDQKPVSQALSYIRNTLSSEIRLA